jgi:phosphoribosylformimino-5-aminoimidazole carboxamide ribotide isomerase
MIEVIPAMDLMDGHCVRLFQGDFSKRTNYSSNPLEIAKLFEEAGFHRLHMVDLDGARKGSPEHLDILNLVCQKTSLSVDFSGGIKSAKDMQAVFEAGASFAAIGSLAVRQQEIFKSWLQYFGAQRILLGVDVRDGKLAIKGWTEQTNIDLMDFLGEMTEAGVSQVFCTDISRDGAMAGPATGLYEKILKCYPSLRLIASGGIRYPEDLKILQNTGCAGAIVGKAIYDNLQNVGEWLNY